VSARGVVDGNQGDEEHDEDNDTETDGGRGRLDSPSGSMLCPAPDTKGDGQREQGNQGTMKIGLTPLNISDGPGGSRRCYQARLVLTRSFAERGAALRRAVDSKRFAIATGKRRGTKSSDG
jgi:hypothetical protein